MWWLEESPSPTRFRKLWLLCTYHGPSAWLVWLNLVITFFSFTPVALYALVVAGGLLGWDNVILMFAYLLSRALLELGYVILIPILLAGGVMFAWPRIPLKVKAVTGVIELAVCAPLPWFIHAANTARDCGLVGCP